MKTSLNDYARECRASNDKWWWRPACIICESFIIDGKWCTNPSCTMHGYVQDVKWIPYRDRNKAELIALMHSELSEALEGVRKNQMDDKLPSRKMEEVELVDCLIRIFDYAGEYKLDLEGAYQEKMAYNKTRADHSHEARLKEGGKAF